jgi:hypothetical protein
MMKKNLTKITAILIIIFTSMSLHAQERWNFQLVMGDNEFGPVNIILYLDRDANSFTMHSSKNADKRIVGCFKAKLGRAMKKLPKGGVFIKMTDGKIIKQDEGTDSLSGIFRIPQVGVKPFKGIQKSGEITGALYDNRNAMATLKGVRVDRSFKFDYNDLPQMIFDTTRKYIFDKSLLEGNEWRKFVKKTIKIAAKAVDDVELFFGVNMLSPKLPFSHFNLLLMTAQQSNDMLKESSSGNVVWKELSTETAYVEIKNFGGDAKEMDSVFLQVLQHQYKNLIIDLRKNPGGGLQAGIAFGKYVSNKEINAGYFVTNKWFANPDNRQNPKFESLQETQAKTTNEFIKELKNTVGKNLILKPGKLVFEGKIYVLTSGKTASTCEPIVDALKRNKLATIVGEKTAGAMLSATIIQLKDNFFLFLPIADYYTADKRRLDQVGVEPDIKIVADKALEYVLDIINLKK